MKLLTVALAAAFGATPLIAEEPLKPSATTAAPAPQDSNEIVARVNDKPITRGELDVALRGMAIQLARQGRPIQQDQLANFKLDILDEIIARELVLQEGSTLTISNLDERVRAEITAAKTRAGGEEGFAQALKETGMTEDDLGRRIRENIITSQTMRSVVDRELTVTPEDVKAFYEANKKQFIRPETVRASHILLRCPPDAVEEIKSDKHTQIEAVRSLLKQGDDFAELARKFSEDTGSATSGGDLGYFPRGTMVKEFDEVAFTLKTNEVSDVITTQFGYHILKVTDHKPAGEMSFDETKDRIELGLKTRKSEEIARRHVMELRAAANVEILLRRPEPGTNTAEHAAPPPKLLPAVETKPVQAPQR